MPTEVFDDPAAFLAALHGKKRQRPRQARPETPRAPAAQKGEGDRLAALDRLARAGWCRTWYDHATGEYWMTHTDGRATPRCATYRAMIDTALEGL